MRHHVTVTVLDKKRFRDLQRVVGGHSHEPLVMSLPVLCH